MTAIEVLKSIGWPTDICVIDFESYYDAEYSLDKLSTIEYILDPRFELLGAAWVECWGESWMPCEFVGPESLEVCLNETPWKYMTVVCHYAKFDISVLQHHFDINPPYIIDTIDLSRHQEARAQHSLEKCAERYGLPTKGEKTFKGLHYSELSNEQKTELAEYANNDVDITAKLVELLLPKVSNPKVEIPLMRHTLKMYLEAELRVDEGAALSLAAEMETERDKAIQSVKPPSRNMAKRLSGNISFVKMLQAALPEGESVPTKSGEPSKNMIPLLGPGQIPALAKVDEGTKWLQNHPRERVRTLINGRLALKSWPLHIARIQGLIAQSQTQKGRLGVPFRYYGGHTGRWSGEGGINLQNFGERVHPLINQVKTLIRTPKGFSHFVSDLAQIEARILAYLAGQDDITEAFRNGRDIYSEFATTEIFHKPVRKSQPTDPAPVAKLLGARRHLGKEAILSLGYGSGDNGFMANCKTKIKEFAMIEPYLKGVVDAYRAKYTKIVSFWRAVEKAFKYVSKYKGVSESFVDVSDLSFFSEGSTTFIKLPSSRILRYQNVKVERFPNVPRSEISWKYGRLWGSALVENICQAVARDILAEIILRAEHCGYRVTHHLHDSFAILLREDQVDPEGSAITALAKQTPAWAEGLPLDVESRVTGYLK